MKTFFKRALIWVMCFAVFSGIAYIYIRSDKIYNANKNESSVPYSSIPQSAAILLKLPQNNILFELDFANTLLNVTVNYEGECPTEGYTVTADESLIAGIIDRIGGIEFSDGKEVLRHTGIQVIQMIYSSFGSSEELKLTVLKAFIEKVSQTGLTRKDFIYIIENSETDLTVPDCFYWSEHMDKLCENAVIK